MTSVNFRDGLVVMTVVTSALCAAPTLSASVVDQSDLTNGQSAAAMIIDGVTIDITSGGGAFKSKTVAGFLGTGVAGGAVDGEIDNQEFITFTFSEAVYVTSFTISHLYMAGNHGDQWNESALASTSAGDFLLTVSDATNATWTGLGAVTNVSPGIEGFGGVWSASGADIFGSPVTWLTLRSGNPGSASKYGDFGFVSLSFAQVPAPGGLALLASLGVFGRRRRARD